MGDSPTKRPRSAYAQPGEIDPALIEAESPRHGIATDPSLKLPTHTPVAGISYVRPAILRPAADWERDGLVAARAAESTPSPLRPNRPTESSPKGLAPAGNAEPSLKNLAPAPGLIEGKPAAFRLGIDPGLSRRDSPLQRGLAPPPLFVSTPPVLRRPPDIRPPVSEKKPTLPTLARPEPKQVSDNPELRELPSLSAPKNLLVRRGVSARFELLPEAKPRWNRIGFSAGGQLVILGLLLLSPMVFTESMQTALKFDVIELAQPVIEVPVAPKAPKPPEIRQTPKVKPKSIVQPKAPDLKPEMPELPPLVPQLAPQRPHIFQNFKPLAPKSRTVEANAPELQQNLVRPEIVVSSAGPKAPKEEVKPNPGAGNSAPGTGSAGASKVQTGSFGDPNGIAASANSNRRGNINPIGSPGLVGGAGHGSGNGAGSGKGLSGTGASNGSGRAGGATAGGSAGVNILYKPKPAYSAEGRDHKIQGDVVLEVVFLASGQIKVIGVVSSLGFGMDDEAIRAAQRIRFTPAMRDGNPIDIPARIRIEFRLLD